MLPGKRWVIFDIGHHSQHIGRPFKPHGRAPPQIGSVSANSTSQCGVKLSTMRVAQPDWIRASDQCRWWARVPKHPGRRKPQIMLTVPWTELRPKLRRP